MTWPFVQEYLPAQAKQVMVEVLRPLQSERMETRRLQ